MEHTIEAFLFDALITTTIIVKLVFLGLAIYGSLLNEKIQIISSPSQKSKDHKRESAVIFWKNRADFIFVILMSIVLIYLFFPRNKSPVIDSETRLLLFLYGVISILTANWQMFFDTSIIWKTLSHRLYSK